ncbi:TPA: response regulator [Aeromonas hydrophila]|jgi:DNA-binding response OmpR family regulator|uniref:response regulator n=1 Tax=Aeromonas hydrophila TaxID=644 RepID=UPI0004651F51|nr:response regulator [Aeromonas hydrophila]BDC84474.1 DNA-binding response regulator [Aeromonas hydrophila]HAT2492220.1 response regulator [Aeromonas hydrophila]HAT2497037.1 response regulator [Aeromonas hydrophila]HAT2512415.1 response regulator [Aeromonas hydrophila]HAT2532860.1 response regulator [Aeromonas hydrophila]
MHKILLVDDDLELTQLLTEILTLEGFQVTVAEDGEEGLQRLAEQHFNLVLLDVMMPKLNGFAMLARLRKTHDTPVLMLTARGDSQDRVNGLEAGADDYLAKPFDDRELLARVRAILRRTQGTQPQRGGSSEEVRFMDLVLQPGLQQVSCHGELLELTATEFGLLECLLRNPGQIVSKSQLSELVLGKKLEPFDRAIDMHLSNLRKKLPERTDGQPRFKTVRGRGYLWLEQA